MLKILMFLVMYIMTKSSKVVLTKKKKNIKHLEKVCMIALGACIAIF